MSSLYIFTHEVSHIWIILAISSFNSFASKFYSQIENFRSENLSVNGQKTEHCIYYIINSYIYLYIS